MRTERGGWKSRRLVVPAAAAAAVFMATACARPLGEGDEDMTPASSVTRMPEFEELEPRAEPPDPLVCLDGTRVTTPAEWHANRKPEVRELFRHFVYGHAPAAPGNVKGTVEREERGYLGGKATLKEVTITFGPPGTPPINLLLVTPNAARPAPVVLAVNFSGNHTVTEDPRVRLSTGWVYAKKKGIVGNRATEEARGTSRGRWEIGNAIARGYGVATFHSSDVDPDFNSFDNGVHKAYRNASAGADAGPGEGESYDWGAVAAWAWGLGRALDYLVTDPDVDGARVAVAGHSRLGKTALLAGAMDDRFAAVISNNSGCTGAALARNRRGETVARINRSFPHWFNANYKRFDDKEDLLPVDQHMLIALAAPRPVLVMSSRGDAWADPEGEFMSAKLAGPVYKLLGTDGFGADEMPPLSRLVKTRVGYHIRPGRHGVSKVDWNVWMDFLDRHLRRGE